MKRTQIHEMSPTRRSPFAKGRAARERSIFPLDFLQELTRSQKPKFFISFDCELLGDADWNDAEALDCKTFAD